MNVPKVFLSYSHDSIEHKKWVLNLATRLRNNGIDAILDQFELKPGDDLPHFMERNLANSDKILMICTENYVAKANDGKGGVGYEKMIITSSLMKTIDENKVIPIIRQLDSSDVPTFLKTKLYINFFKDSDFEFSYDELVRTIHNSPLFVKPKVGNNPFKTIERINYEENIVLLDDIMKLAIDDYSSHESTYDRYITTTTIMQQFNISRILAEITANKIVKLGLLAWKVQNEKLVLTEKGKLYALEKGMA